MQTGNYYLRARYYDPNTGRFTQEDTHWNVGNMVYDSEGSVSLEAIFQSGNLYGYYVNNPIGYIDESGEFKIPAWLKVTIGALGIAGAVALTTATGGAAAPALLAALKIAAISATTGAAIGAGTNAVGHRLSTGSWEDAEKAALKGAVDGAVDGIMWGGIAAAGGATAKAVSQKTVTSLCFVAGTNVLAENGLVEIENIKTGDYVYSENPETGEKGLKRVAQTFENEINELVHVYVNGEEIVTTSGHPFYVSDKGWVGADELKTGDILVLYDGTKASVEKTVFETLDAPVKVYNFEVEGFHTYYVGESSILVHNKCEMPLKGKYAIDAASKLGYKPTNYFSQGQRVFYNAKTKMYITADIDGHIGGAWKAAKTIKGLSSKSTRLGTFDVNMKKIGK